MRIDLLGSHPVFKGWSPRELKIANGHAKMKTYPPNTTIVSEKKLRADRVFFIASGQCNVVRKLILRKQRISPKSFKYSLPPIDQRLLSTPIADKIDVFQRKRPTKPDLNLFRRNGAQFEKLNAPLFQYCDNTSYEKRFFTICQLSEGDYFNVGESMDGLYVVSVGRVEVVQVGASAFARHSERLKNLEDLKNQYLEKIPNAVKTYNKYISDRKWNCYKRNLVNDIVERRRAKHAVDVNEVPGITSTEQIYYTDNENIV